MAACAAAVAPPGAAAVGEALLVEGVVYGWCRGASSVAAV